MRGRPNGPEFNGRFRAECLNAHWFLSLADAREKMEDCRPHGAIDQKTPITSLNHTWRSQPATVSKPENI
jgi:putative transposase